MKHEISLGDEFGPSLADGARAVEFRVSRIDPYAEICEKIVLDFGSVRDANSSFVNALVAGAIEHHGTAILDRLVFKGCNPVVRVLVESAISLGVQRAGERLQHPA